MSSSIQTTTPTTEAEALLSDLADALAIPEHLYGLVEKRYRAVSSWLERPASKFHGLDCNTYAQGSFSLGTVVRPWLEDEEYDLDIAFEVVISKTLIMQGGLKALLGVEMEAYAKAHQMKAKEEKQRCWRLHYADEARFHMDIVPAIPDASRQRRIFESLRIENEWVESAVSITDTEHENYEKISDEWPLSNPKGYMLWFRSRMKGLFEAQRRRIALLESKVNVEDVPHYRVRTPLQSAILILKRHRDARFEGDPDDKPISIILTTLAARAYGQEVSIADALYGILDRMDSAEFITKRNGVTWIENPTNSEENFADKWEDHPEREAAFHEWLGVARTDFRAAAGLRDLDSLVDVLAPRIGRPLLEQVIEKRKGRLINEHRFPANLHAKKLRLVKDAPHRKPLLWPELATGTVAINRATVNRDGFRPYSIRNDEDTVPRFCDLVFEATTTVPQPYDVYWQVVNTGEEAKRAKDLRGGYQRGYSMTGTLTKKEPTKYRGTHSIECFIVKGDYCVARSGPFLVNIN